MPRRTKRVTSASSRKLSRMDEPWWAGGGGLSCGHSHLGTDMNQTQNAQWDALVSVTHDDSGGIISWNNLMGVTPSLQQFESDPVTVGDRDLFQSWLDAARPLPNNSGQDTTVLPPNSANSNSGFHISGTPSSGSSPAFPLTFLSNFNSSESSEHGGHSPFDPSLFNASSYPVDTSRHTSPTHPAGIAQAAVVPGRGSLEAMRLRTMARIPTGVALFICIPNGQHNRRNLFQPDILPYMSPSISDIFRALRNCNGAPRDVVNSDVRGPA
ncbi:hypothetical protein B0H14DRAFT_2591154 [Mycena olivaceomarginata]|nr:hypothetical protein B0H14DRAFT_2591154 [Mycena olivaceomarginata]